MKLHMMLAGAAAIAVATGAIAQDAASPAEPTTAAETAAPPATSPDANAAMGPASTTAPDTGTNAADATAGTPADTSSAAASPDPATGVAAAPPASDAASAAATPAQTTGTDAQSATAAPAPAAGVDPAKAQAADQMIAQNWSKYDAGSKGQLTPLEFGSWVLAAQGNDMTAQIEKSRQSRQANLPSTKVLNATAAEFSKADSNKDRMISQDELRSYLAG
jgi:hypothetical protein